jgi:hypothetical protein
VLSFGKLICDTSPPYNTQLFQKEYAVREDPAVWREPSSFHAVQGRDCAVRKDEGLQTALIFLVLFSSRKKVRAPGLVRKGNSNSFSGKRNCLCALAAAIVFYATPIANKKK